MVTLPSAGRHRESRALGNLTCAESLSEGARLGVCLPLQLPSKVPTPLLGLNEVHMWPQLFIASALCVFC